jgi:Zn finger protein HypA/HybF involved in hydrogenase expression
MQIPVDYVNEEGAVINTILCNQPEYDDSGIVWLPVEDEEFECMKCKLQFVSTPGRVECPKCSSIYALPVKGL